MRRALFVIALLLIPGVAYAGGGGVDLTGCPGYAEGATVVMQDSCFSGVAHFAPSDTTITVRNDGGLPHTFTAVDGSFDTGDVMPGESAELTFDQSGIYRVFCALHGTAAGEGMAGVLVVGEATPATVLSPIDTSAIQAAVAEENAAVVDEIEDQRTRLQTLLSTQAQVLVGLDEVAAAAAAPDEPAVAPASVPAETADPERTVVLVLVGLAAGIALAALLTALRLGMTRDRRSTLERLEPEVS